MCLYRSTYRRAGGRCGVGIFEIFLLGFPLDARTYYYYGFVCIVLLLRITAGTRRALGATEYYFFIGYIIL